uniref:Ig-like domain-containing protein n=1 Tax=uncultured Dysgonomonas sp. TaxID=206096 RepID=UPI002637133E|nr:Ig-like domain-containing protein [uncultured Dysgonomonas sp.]
MKKLLSLFTCTLFLLNSCSSDDDNKNRISLSESSTTLNSTKTYQIKATSDTKISYAAENEYHAKVSDSGLITAGKIGETAIILTNGDDTKSFKVTVSPESTMYPDPNLEFGISKADLIKKLGTPNKETSDGISYNNFSTKAPQVAYLFDSSNKLKSVGVIVNTAYSSELGTFLRERYVYGTSIEENYTLVFVNALKLENATILIGASLYNTSYWMTIYMPYSNIKSRAQKVNEMAKVAKVVGIN